MKGNQSTITKSHKWNSSLMIIKQWSEMSEAEFPENKYETIRLKPAKYITLFKNLRKKCLFIDNK